MLKINYIIVAILVVLLIYLIMADDRALEFIDAQSVGSGSGLGAGVGAGMGGSFGAGTMNSAGTFGSRTTAGGTTGSVVSNTGFGSGVGATDTGFGGRNLTSAETGFLTGRTDTGFAGTNTPTYTNVGYNGTGSFGASSLTGQGGRLTTDTGNYVASRDNTGVRSQLTTGVAPVPTESQSLMNRGTYGNTVDGRTYTTPQYVNAVGTNVPLVAGTNLGTTSTPVAGTTIAGTTAGTTIYPTASGTAVQVSTQQPAGQAVAVGRNTTPMNAQRGLLDGNMYMRTSNDTNQPNHYCGIMGNVLKSAVNQGQVNQSTASDIWGGGQTLADLCGPYNTY